MPFKQMEVREQRVEFVVRALSGREPSSQLCQEFGISRPTGYLWLVRYRDGGVAAIEERSRRPLRSPTQTAPDVEARIVALRKEYPDWGARKLAKCCLAAKASSCRRALCIASCCVTGWCATRTVIVPPSSASSAPRPTNSGRWTSRGRRTGRRRRQRCRCSTITVAIWWRLRPRRGPKATGAAAFNPSLRRVRPAGGHVDGPRHSMVERAVVRRLDPAQPVDDAPEAFSCSFPVYVIRRRRARWNDPRQHGAGDPPPRRTLRGPSAVARRFRREHNQSARTKRSRCRPQPADGNPARALTTPTRRLGSIPKAHGPKSRQPRNHRHPRSSYPIAKSLIGERVRIVRPITLPGLLLQHPDPRNRPGQPPLDHRRPLRGRTASPRETATAARVFKASAIYRPVSEKNKAGTGTRMDSFPACSPSR